MSLVKKTQKFFGYWYQRYLLATEMYMVEPWEKAVIHLIFLVLFALFWWFNTSLVCYLPIVKRENDLYPPNKWQIAYSELYLDIVKQALSIQEF